MYNVCDTLFGFRREITFAGYDDRDRCLMENGIEKKNYKPTWSILESSQAYLHGDIHISLIPFN